MNAQYEQEKVDSFSKPSSRKIINNWVANNNTIGIEFGFSTWYNHVEDNTVEKNVSGIYSNQASYNKIKRNVVRNNSSNGIYITWGDGVEVTQNSLNNNNLPETCSH